MFEQTIETSATPHITVSECLGNLVVRGSEEKRITFHARGEENDVTMEKEGETFTIGASVDCFLICPPGTSLTVNTVRGNLKIEGVKGPVAIGDVHGNTNLRAIGPTALEQTFGNLSASQVTGDLSVQTTRGNVQVRQVEGSLSLGRTDGNLAIEGVEGNLTADRVRGNIRLGPPFSSGTTHHLNADGNMTIYLPAVANLRLVLRAGGFVRSHVPGLELDGTGNEAQVVLGTGEASLEARVGGQMRLYPLRPEDSPARGFSFDSMADLEGLGAQIEASIAEAMAELEARLESSLGYMDSEKISRQIERTTERARLKAEQEVEKARRKAEHETERARLRAERAERRWQRVSGQRSRQEPISDEERLRVLRLVEDGKISPEQAASLLAAMEGR